MQIFSAVAAVGAGGRYLFAGGFTTTAVLLRLPLALAALLVATTHFCLGSWLWARLPRAIRPFGHRV